MFRPLEEGRLYPGDSYERAAAIVMNLWANCRAPELNDQEQIQNYYMRYFSGETGNEDLEKALQKKDYKSVERNYKLIRNAGVSLVAPWPEKIELFQKIRCATREGCMTPALLREAAPIIVTCYDESSVRECAEPIILRKGKVTAETVYFLLNSGFEGCYDSEIGFAPRDNLYEDLML